MIERLAPRAVRSQPGRWQRRTRCLPEPLTTTKSCGTKSGSAAFNSAQTASSRARSAAALAASAAERSCRAAFSATAR